MEKDENPIGTSTVGSPAEEPCFCSSLNVKVNPPGFSVSSLAISLMLDIIDEGTNATVTIKFGNTLFEQKSNSRTDNTRDMKNYTKNIGRTQNFTLQFFVNSTIQANLFPKNEANYATIVAQPSATMLRLVQADIFMGRCRPNSEGTNCDCLEGYFKMVIGNSNSGMFECLPCHPFCKTCSGSNNANVNCTPYSTNFKTYTNGMVQPSDSKINLRFY